MTDSQYKIHIKEVYRLKKKPYYRDFNFDVKGVVNSAFVLMNEKGIEYNQDTFYKLLWAIMGKERYEHIKQHEYLWKNQLKYHNHKKAEYRAKGCDWYIQHLLLKKYSLDEINNNPNLMIEKRIEIQNLRKNNNQPIENELPTFPPELIDLQIINPEYKGYAITEKGELYSCKTLFKTDVIFTTQWRPITKRKNGCIRLNIKGVKKELGIKSVLKEIQNHKNS